MTVFDSNWTIPIERGKFCGIRGVSMNSVKGKTEEELAKARLHGLRRLAQLRKAAEPSLQTRAVCDFLGASRETIRRKIQRKELLALPHDESQAFPAFQFQKGKVLPGVKEVLKGLNTDSPFVALSFLLSRSPSFNNMRAIDALKSGLKDEVLAEARSFLRP